jgi:hypothetical protein
MVKWTKVNMEAAVMCRCMCAWPAGLDGFDEMEKMEM